MKRLNVETIVGVFMIAGFLAFAWISVRLGDIKIFATDTYAVSARFRSVSGVKKGATVEIAGVAVGEVSDVTLDREHYEAVVSMAIKQGVKIQTDSIASVRTAGIIGDRYISISPGGEEDFVKPGGEIFETESAINIEELVSKYIFEKK